MYNTHRGMVPAPNSRLTELLDQLRQEFENQSRSTGEFEHQCTFDCPFLCLHVCPPVGFATRNLLVTAFSVGSGLSHSSSVQGTPRGRMKGNNRRKFT